MLRAERVARLTARLGRVVLCIIVALITLAPGPTAAAESGQEPPGPAFADSVLEHVRVLAARDRIIGGEGLEETVDYVVERLQASGLEPVVDRYPLYVPVYEPHQLVSADGTAVLLHPLPPNGPILSVAGPGGIQGTLKDAGSAALEEMDGTHWEGSVALVDAAIPGAWLRAFDYGAQAVVFVAPELGEAESVQAGRFDPPYVYLAADLPRFWADGQAGERLRDLARQEVRVEIQGDGRWQVVEAPHVSAVIEGETDELVVLHADVDRTEGLGGPVPGAREAISASLLLALAEQWADETPARTVVLSFGSGQSRGFASLRQWIMDASPDRLMALLAVDLSDTGEGLALTSSAELYSDWGFRPGRGIMAQVSAEVARVSQSRGVAIEDLNTQDVIEAHRRLLGRAVGLPSDVAIALGWRALTLTTHDDARPWRGTPWDRLEAIDETVLRARASDVHQVLQAFLALDGLQPMTPSPATGVSVDVEVVLAPSYEGHESLDEAWVQIWPGSPFGIRMPFATALRTERPSGQLPWAMPADADGMARFAGIRSSDVALVDGYVLAQGSAPVLGRWQILEPGFGATNTLELVPSRIITLTGWPEALGEALVLDPETGDELVPHELEFVERLAVLHLPRDQDALLHRDRVDDVPPFTLELAAPAQDQDRHIRVARSDLLMAETVLRQHEDAAAALRQAAARNPLMEGLFGLAGREVADARTALNEGHLLVFEERLAQGQEHLAGAVRQLQIVERDARVSFVILMVLAVPAALTLGTLAAMRRSRRVRLGVSVLMFAGFYVLARFLHPGAQLTPQGPEYLLAAALFIGGAAVLMITGFHRFERWAAARLRRLGRVREMDRSTLVRAAMDLGAVQMGRRPLRSILTITAVSLFVFGLLSIGGLAPELRTVPIHARGEAAFEGVYVTSPNHRTPLAERVVDDVASWPGDLGPALALRWQLPPPSPAQRALALDPGAEEPLPSTPFNPRYVVEMGDERAIGQAVVSLSAGFEAALGLDAALLAGRWLRDDALEIMLPTHAAESLGVEPGALPGTTVSLFLEDLRRGESPSGWVPDPGPAIEVEVVGVVDAGTWDDITGLDLRTLRAHGVWAGDTFFLSHAVGLAKELPLRGVGGAARESLPLHAVGEQLAGLPYVVYAGSDGTRFVLGSLRAISGEMAMPLGILLVLGVLIVANTMLGAVYEREEELRQFHVVGMAPYQVRSLLMTEAGLIGAVAVVAGWSLTMVAGTAVQRLGWYEGIALNVGSWQAMLLLGGVLGACTLTALVPARRAAERVAPSDRLAEVPASGDHIDLDLPFTVKEGDLPALLAFLWHVFNPHEATMEHLEVHHLKWIENEADSGQPALRFTVMMRPTEVGVNQEVLLNGVPVSGMAGDEPQLAVHITIHRKTGERDVWRRRNVGFLAAVRKELLAWELVSPEDRQRYALRAKDIATNYPEAWRLE